ncbi:hypothetical protein [Terasakiispira papahanaumokuakeensis]|nr:hypothetical protein [Terasakiispira papahanaumokuakeensis]
MKRRDPLLDSLIAQTSLRRLVRVMVILMALWLAIFWAVALP